MAPVTNNKPAQPLPINTDVKNRPPPNAMPLNKKSIAQRELPDSIKLIMKKRDLEEAKQQFREASDKLTWIGEHYGVQSPEYRDQQQVTQQLYDQMVKLQQEVDELQKRQPSMPPWLRNLDGFEKPKKVALNPSLG